MQDENGKVKGDSAYSSIVFRLTGPRIDLAVRHFQSFIPNFGMVKETEDSKCMFAVKKTTSTETKN